MPMLEAEARDRIAPYIVYGVVRPHEDRHGRVVEDSHHVARGFFVILYGAYLGLHGLFYRTRGERYRADM